MIFFLRFRLLAFDQGSFTFVDVRHGQWPIILVTYPKIPWLTTRDVEAEEYQKEKTKYIRLFVINLLIYVKLTCTQCDRNFKLV